LFWALFTSNHFNPNGYNYTLLFTLPLFQIWTQIKIHGRSTFKPNQNTSISNSNQLDTYLLATTSFNLLFFSRSLPSLYEWAPISINPPDQNHSNPKLMDLLRNCEASSPRETLFLLTAHRELRSWSGFRLRYVIFVAELYCTPCVW